MTPARAIARVAAAGYAALVLGAVMSPALVLQAAAGRGGTPVDSLGDVFAVSLLVGGGAAALAWRRVRSSGPGFRGRWTAELVGLGLLTPLAAGLPALALHTAAQLPADTLAVPGAVAALWGGSLVAAVLAATGARWIVQRWTLRGSGPGAAAGAPAVPRTPPRKVDGRVPRRATV